MARVLAGVRFAVRSLRNAPLFASVAVLSIAFGIAANTAVFTLLDQVFVRTLPVDRPSELRRVVLRTETTNHFNGRMVVRFETRLKNRNTFSICAAPRRIQNS
jgi:hypothetical protein